jgi:hypothetical protein
MTRPATNDSDPIAWTGQPPVIGRGTQAADRRMNRAGSKSIQGDPDLHFRGVPRRHFGSRSISR